MSKRKVELTVIEGGKHKPASTEPPYYQMQYKTEDVSFRLSEEDSFHIYLTSQHLPYGSKEEHLAYIVLAMDCILDQLSEDLFLHVVDSDSAEMKVKVDLKTVDTSASDGAWCKLRCDEHVKNVIEKMAIKLECSKPQLIRHCLRVCAFLIEKSESGTRFYHGMPTKKDSNEINLHSLLIQGISPEYQQKSIA